MTTPPLDLETLLGQGASCESSTAECPDERRGGVMCSTHAVVAEVRRLRAQVAAVEALVEGSIYADTILAGMTRLALRAAGGAS